MRFAIRALIFFLLLAPLDVSRANEVVVADGVTAEIIFALGAQDRIAGVDETSRYPAAALLLPQIGYFRRLSAEGVLSLAPSILLAAPSVGPSLGGGSLRDGMLGTMTGSIRKKSPDHAGMANLIDQTPSKTIDQHSIEATWL